MLIVSPLARIHQNQVFSHAESQKEDEVMGLELWARWSSLHQVYWQSRPVSFLDLMPLDLLI